MKHPEKAQFGITGSRSIAAPATLAVLLVVGACVGPSTVALRRAPEASPVPRLPPALATSGVGVVVQDARLLVSDQTGHFRAVTTGLTEGYVEEPAIRPDGKRIAYTRVIPAPIATSNASTYSPGFTSEIWQVGPDGANEVLAQPEAPGIAI